MISQRAKYALRALVALARTDGVTTVASIAAGEKIPRKFLEQILLDLKRRGFVVSTRGARGGWALGAPAGEISFADVLRAIDGPLAPVPCLSVTAYRACPDCTNESACAIRRAFAPAVAAQRAELARTTIAGAARTTIAGAARGGAPAKRKRPVARGRDRRQTAPPG